MDFTKKGERSKNLIQSSRVVREGDGEEEKDGILH